MSAKIHLNLIDQKFTSTNIKVIKREVVTEISSFISRHIFAKLAEFYFHTYGFFSLIWYQSALKNNLPKNVSRIVKIVHSATLFSSHCTWQLFSIGWPGRQVNAVIMYCIGTWRFLFLPAVLYSEHHYLFLCCILLGI